MSQDPTSQGNQGQSDYVPGQYSNPNQYGASADQSAGSYQQAGSYSAEQTPGGYSQPGAGQDAYQQPGYYQQQGYANPAPRGYLGRCLPAAAPEDFGSGYCLSGSFYPGFLG